MKIIAHQIKAKELQPGDLFSSGDQYAWDNYDPLSLGQQVFIRTEAPCPSTQADITLYRIEVIREEGGKMPRIVVLRSKLGIFRNAIETEPLTDDLFLEFGQRVGEHYEYIALMRGKPNYTKGKEVKQLYFTHFVAGKWRVLDDTCLKLVEDYDAREQAIARLRELANDERG